MKRLYATDPQVQEQVKCLMAISFVKLAELDEAFTGIYSYNHNKPPVGHCMK